MLYTVTSKRTGRIVAKNLCHKQASKYVRCLAYSIAKTRAS